MRGEPTPTSWRDQIVGITTGSAPGIFYFQQSIRDERYKLISNPLAETESNTNLFAQAYLEHRNAHFSGGCTPEEIGAASSGVQSAYDRFLHPPRYELYDLQSDPHEFVNLAESPTHAENKNRLNAALREWQRDTDDPFADANRLQTFVRSQLDAIGTNYRGDRSFRWPYLDEFNK